MLSNYDEKKMVFPIGPQKKDNNPIKPNEKSNKRSKSRLRSDMDYIAMMTGIEL
jgi:hypothetical protein